MCFVGKFKGGYFNGIQFLVNFIIFVGLLIHRVHNIMS